MSRDCAITHALKRAQITVFEQAAKLGITQKVIHYDTGGENGGISLSALGQYARGETAMGLPALLKLIDVIPDNLLSLLLPAGRLIVRVPEEIDHDEIEKAARDFLATKGDAHREDSEMGRDIGPNEKKALTAKAVVLKAVA